MSLANTTRDRWPTSDVTSAAGGAEREQTHFSHILAPHSRTRTKSQSAPTPTVRPPRPPAPQATNSNFIPPHLSGKFCTKLHKFLRRFGCAKDIGILFTSRLPARSESLCAKIIIMFVLGGTVTRKKSNYIQTVHI